MTAPNLSLKGRALRLLAGREHSRAELERKLQDHADDPTSLQALLDDLCARGWVSEQRVAESVLHRRAGKLGAARVLQELRTKGLSDEVMAEAAEQLRASEVQRARQVWQSKFGQPPRDPAERARQLRFLAARGFSGSTVQQVLKDDD